MPLLFGLPAFAGRGQGNQQDDDGNDEHDRPDDPAPGVELPESVRVGDSVVVVVGASEVVVVDCSVVVVGDPVVVVVGCSVVVVVGASVVVVDPSGAVVGGSVVGGSEVVVCAGASAEGVCEARPVVVLTDGLWARFDPPPVPQAAITVAAPRASRQCVPQRTARRVEVRCTM